MLRARGGRKEDEMLDARGGMRSIVLQVRLCASRSVLRARHIDLRAGGARGTAQAERANSPAKRRMIHGEKYPRRE